MTPPLLALLLTLAWFGASNLALSVLASVLARLLNAARVTDQPRRAARMLFALKVAPASLSIFFTAGVFLPAQWLWEPARSEESAGYSIILFAVCGAAIIGVTIARALRDTRRTAEIDRRWRTAARTAAAGAAPGLPVFFVGDPSPVMSLAGIFRPRVFVADDVAAALTPEEFDVSLAHEMAHVRSGDNLKRLIAMWCPDVLGAGPLGRDLAARWRAATEFAADADAAGGDEDRAVVLASALVKVARLTADVPATPLAISCIHHQALLAARVERLLRPSDPVARARGVSWTWVIAAATAVMLTLVVASHSPWFALHQATETLIRTLP